MLGALIGGILGSKSAGDAAEIQAQAANRGLDLQGRMYEEQKAAQEPWRQAGLSALGKMQDADFQRDFTANDFQADPGYAFRVAEGQKAMERSAAARGGLQSGGFMKGLERYSQGVASDEYQNAYNRFNADRDRRFGRLGQIGSMGQNATNALGQLGSNYANQASEGLMASANARANGVMGKGNAWMGTINNAAKMGMDAATAGMGGGMGGLSSLGQGGNWMKQQQSAQPQLGLGYNGKYF